MSGQTPVSPAEVVIYPGVLRANPNIDYGQQDQFITPTQYPRFATPWNQVQLSNGWDGTNMGKRDTSPAASYLAEVSAFQPGQMRLSGTNYADFPQTPMAPQQWNAYVQSTAGQQPDMAGGVGTVSAPVFNPGSGA